MEREFIIRRTFERLVAQGGPSAQRELPYPQAAPGGTILRCKYRSNNGRRCAAGMWIPDALYDPIMEGKSVEYDMIRAALPDGTASVLTVLQGVHDVAASELEDGKEEWETILRRLFNRTFPTVSL